MYKTDTNNEAKRLRGTMINIAILKNCQLLECTKNYFAPMVFSLYDPLEFLR